MKSKDLAEAIVKLADYEYVAVCGDEMVLSKGEGQGPDVYTGETIEKILPASGKRKVVVYNIRRGEFAKMMVKATGCEQPVGCRL